MNRKLMLSILFHFRYIYAHTHTDTCMRATKMVSELKKLSCRKRLEALSLPILEKMRGRGDLIPTFKFLKEVVNVDRIRATIN